MGQGGSGMVCVWSGRSLRVSTIMVEGVANGIDSRIRVANDVIIVIRDRYAAETFSRFANITRDTVTRNRLFSSCGRARELSHG